MSLELQEPTFDRSFKEIYEELRARIPRYNPAWTNFNDSDPGITLLQLFAWLAEVTLHKMGDVPRKHYMKFAKLLGLQLSPARPAAVQLVFTAKASEPASTIRERSRFSAQVEGAQPPTVIFETTQALDVIAAPPPDLVMVAGGSIEKINTPSVPATQVFYPLGRNPQEGDALYLGFKPHPNVQKPFPLKMRFLALRPPTDTNGRPQRIGEQNLDLVPPVDLVWEFRPKKAQAVWERLNVFKDGTVALTRDGYVDVEGPQDIEASTDDAVKSLVAEDRYWLRVRLDQNTYPVGRAPRLEYFVPNAVDAINLQTEEDERPLGTSNGRGEQYFDIPDPPIDPESLILEVRPAGAAAEKDWERVDDFFASKRDDKHFTLDATAGRITFGDGLEGTIPTAGAVVVAVKYRHGGGKAGNLAGPGAVKTMVTQVPGIEKVTNLRTATGGADEQDLNDFIKHAPARLRTNDRAVTGADFESQALGIDGVRKAKALGGRHPDYPGVEVPGAITVFIVPDSDARPPLPSAELIRSVCNAFDKVRLITTEVFVAAPQFIEVRVEARVLAAPEAAFDQVSQAARKRLDDFLSPLNRTFGENVSPAAIYAQLFGPPNEDSGVRSVDNLRLYVQGQLHPDGAPIDVPADALVYPGAHLIVVRPDRDERATR